MITDLNSHETPSTLETDVCIVGAGAAGICLAVTLARRGIKVVLLESGGVTHEPAIHALNKAEVVGLSHAGIHDGRFRVFGGTTTRWGGQMLPLEPIDFENRPWMRCSGWPIRYEEVLPY